MRPPKRCTQVPAPIEPTRSPAMNIDRTIETSGVVIPNCAIARRSQISSYRIPQNPETKKNRKYHMAGTVQGSDGSRRNNESRTPGETDAKDTSPM
jgi:hypothetical protein